MNNPDFIVSAEFTFFFFADFNDTINSELIVPKIV